MNDWIIAFTTKAGEHNIQSDPIMQGGDITLLINAAKQWQGAVFFYNHGSDTRILVSHRSNLLGDNESKNCFNFPIFSIIRPTEGGVPSLRYLVLLPLLLFDPAVSDCRTQLWKVQAERKGDTTFPAQTGDDASGLTKIRLTWNAYHILNCTHSSLSPNGLGNASLIYAFKSLRDGNISLKTDRATNINPN
jgi:hypothetical protein